MSNRVPRVVVPYRSEFRLWPGAESVGLRACVVVEKGRRSRESRETLSDDARTTTVVEQKHGVTLSEGHSFSHMLAWSERGRMF